MQLTFGKKYRGWEIASIGQADLNYLIWLLTLPRFRHHANHSAVRKRVIKDLQAQAQADADMMNAHAAMAAGTWVPRMVTAKELLDGDAHEWA
jgi:hypothetical protein